jgi:flagellar biosynthesis/type III secretory pathway protein FliH
LAAATCALLAAPVAAQNNNAAFDRGYREGLQQGNDDARRGRIFEIERHSEYRDGDRGYNRRDGDRNWYRDNFRRGYASGYRTGYNNVRGDVYRGADIYQNRRDDRGPRRLRGYQEPAFARGYSDGWEKGLEDSRDRDRYDPVRHGEYRSGDNGYQRSYGSRDAYKNNYRSGFRQGYEDGYRDSTRGAYRR